MKNIGKYVNRIIELLFHIIICGIIGFLIVGFIVFPNEQQTDIYECQKLEMDWYQVTDGGGSVPVSLPGRCEVERGEKLTITGTLPDTLDAGVTPYLCFHSSLQDLQIYIDGEKRGEYTTESTRLWGKYSVSAYYFVRLKPSDAGKTITFTSVTDSKYSGVMREIYCGTVFWYLYEVCEK